MRFFAVAILFEFAIAEVINLSTKCRTVRAMAYEEEVLKEGVNSPYQLAIDHDTNTLFFSYTAKTKELFKIAILNLDTLEYDVVRGINGGFATAIDSKNHVVYMGGKDGIYTFNYDTKTATNVNIKNDKNIWQMFYKDGLYFTTYPDEKAFIYKDNEILAISELREKVMVLAVKNDGSYAFSNSSGLFTYSKSQGKTENVGDYTINGFTSDKDGNIYFSTPNKIYFINDKNHLIEEVASLEDVYGVAIQANDNIIYADANRILRLKPSIKKCMGN